MNTILAACVLTGASAAIAADQVTNLPGFGTPVSDMYSGYLSIPGGKHLHYVFTASLNSPATAPVLLWLNGGPGCSSMEGFMEELGLYHFQGDSNTTLVTNPYSWTNMTNTLYLESPAGVGFSYADTPGGLVHNDSGAAYDVLQALLVWFAGFPEYAPNDFYITGESYAGIYVPTTAFAVVQSNAGGASKINLKGIMVGNGCLGNTVGVCSGDPLANKDQLDQWYGHGLVSPVTNAAAYAACGDFSSISPACNNALNAASNEVGEIDIYNIYSPQCINSGFPPAAGAWKRPASDRELSVPGPVACIDAGQMTSYFNTVEVQDALHVTNAIPWIICTSNFTYTSTEPDERAVIYPTLLQNGVRVLIYNGEADACVPHTDNQRWTASMNYTVTSPWTAWSTDSTGLDVAGYVTQYQAYAAGDFTFTTIRGAGHMVPQTQPVAAYAMLSTWLNQQPWF